MARLPLVEVEAAPAPVREVLEALPVKLNIFRMLAHAETCFRPVMSLGAAILSRTQLDPKLREFAVLQAAKLTPGEYEWVQHVPIALAAGATQAQIDALEREEWEAGCFDALESLVLRFGADTIQKTKVSDALFAALREHLCEREIVELLLTLGYYGMMARLTEITQTVLDPPADTAIIDAIPRR